MWYTGTTYGHIICKFSKFSHKKLRCVKLQGNRRADELSLFSVFDSALYRLQVVWAYLLNTKRQAIIIAAEKGVALNASRYIWVYQESAFTIFNPFSIIGSIFTIDLNLYLTSYFICSGTLFKT